MKYWTQCDLKHDNSIQTVWIEDQFAKEGNILSSEEDDNLYIVKKVYSSIPDSEVKENERKNLVFKKQLK